MAFIQPCFIRKNTPELRKKLVELGYNRYPLWMADWSDDDSRYVYLVTDVLYYTYPQKPTNPKNGEYIDCGTNENLFLALAALRDDSDINQYFICDKVSITLGKTYYSGDYLYYQYDEFFDKQNWHKATVEELIEHFSDCLLYKEE